MEIAFLSPSPMELAVIAVIALLVLGPNRLPEAARSLGKGMKEMRDSFAGAMDSDSDDDDDEDYDDDDDLDDDLDEDEAEAEDEADLSAPGDEIDGEPEPAARSDEDGSGPESAESAVKTS